MRAHSQSMTLKRGSNVVPPKSRLYDAALTLTRTAIDFQGPRARGNAMPTKTKQPTRNKQKDDTMGRFSVDVELANNDDLALARRGRLATDQVRRVKIRGVVDCGATRL